MLEHPRRLQALQNEINILRMLNHKNIIKLYEVYENDLYVHIVMEYLKGGELFKQLQEKGAYSEKDAALMFKLILEALDYCHERGVIHRDLKPENMILIGGSANKWELKIADFGLSAIVDPKNLQTLKCGSPGYVAPEVLNSMGYDTKADIYSAGVILIVLLTGKLPFSGRNYHEVISKNKEGDIVFEESYWKTLSPEAKDLAQKMVIKDPTARISAKNALQHPWLYKENYSGGILLSAMENMKKYNDKNRFNMEKIKPEFSMVTCTPLFTSRNSPIQGSPLAIQPRFVSNTPQFKGGRLFDNRKGEEAKMETKAGPVIIRNIRSRQMAVTVEKDCCKFVPTWKKKQEEQENFKDEDIDEQCSTDRTTESISNTLNNTKNELVIKPFIPHVLSGRKIPMTPGFSKRILPIVAVPLNKESVEFRKVPDLKENKKEEEKSRNYLQKLTGKNMQFFEKMTVGARKPLVPVLSPITETAKELIENVKLPNYKDSEDDDSNFVSALSDSSDEKPNLGTGSKKIANKLLKEIN